VASADETVRETERLRLRRLRHTDLDQVASMVADPEQMRYYGRPKPRSEVEQWLDWNLGLYEQHGFGTWCVESGPEYEFVGYCGLRPLRLEGRREVELAWHIRKVSWNRGLATEAAQASMELGFDRFELPSLVAMIHPANRASVRVAEKLDMAAERQLIHHGEPTVLHRAARG
jgi:RimJ/RimL family protein N-acetyltransferase